MHNYISQYKRSIGYSILVIVLVFSALLALTPDGVAGVPSFMFWSIAAVAGLLLVISLLVQYWPSLKLLFHSPDCVDRHIKEAEWYLQNGDYDAAWQSYIKAKISCKHLPVERRTEAHEKLLVLFGELEQISDSPHMHKHKHKHQHQDQPRKATHSRK